MMCQCHFSTGEQGGVLDCPQRAGMQMDGCGRTCVLRQTVPCHTWAEISDNLLQSSLSSGFVILFGGASELMIASHLGKYCGKCSARRELIQKQNRFIFRSGRKTRERDILLYFFSFFFNFCFSPQSQVRLRIVAFPSLIFSWKHQL